MNLSVCQMMVVENKEDNLKKAESMIRRSVLENKANLVVLPEIFNGPYSIEAMQATAEPEGGPTTQLLSRLAAELNIVVVGGSIAEAADDRIYNTAFIYNEVGERVGRHRKMHLFDVNIVGGVSFQESSIVAPGNDVTVVETSLGKIGVAICYDMRFPELMRLMTLQGAEMIVVPAAFNTTTGPAHWKDTIKMRAVDNQVFFAAASPARNLASDYHAYGFSQVVDPWGTVLAETDETEGIITATLNPQRLTAVREQLPLLKHRRTDLYELKECQ
ncbi:carbon-nitrogen hydrolase family protein [Anoxynatronum buryatiense]|uniref:carbon-nitrogen hydrolase family protein n=1 Tax=Anoxynatronum buryatiense TaxID=489973 RepID=UPI003211F542